MPIDKVDKKIVGLLFEDSRRNFAEIAQEIGISKNAAWSRYKKLRQMKIINGATVQINYKKLGYDAVATLLLDVDNQRLSEVSKYISARIPDVFGPFVSHSIYNLRAIVTLKTLRELGEIKEELRRLPGVFDINSSIWTDVWFTPENLSLIPIRPIESIDKTSVSEDIFNADEVDLIIIRMLAEDSKRSFRNMASELKVSVDTVARRYEALKKEHIIASRIRIDPSKLGYSAIAHFFAKVLPNYDTIDVIREMFSMQDTFYFMKCTGEFNIGIMLMVKEIKDMLRAADCIATIKGIRRVDTTANNINPLWPVPRTYTSTLSRFTH